MPLFELRHSPTEEPDGLEVVATKDEQTIQVLVTRGAINAMQAPGMGSYMERFSAHRVAFLKIASAKWDQGKVETDGRVYVTIGDLTDPDLIIEEPS